jgi:Tol biopolymer transport system component
MDHRTLAPGQRCQVFVVDADGGEPRLVLERDDLLLEAPNWTLDGQALILNGAGVLWRFDLATSALDEIEISGVPELNNDHVLDPDGEHVFISAQDHHIHRAPLAGGAAVRITNDGPPDLHFLHGVSPDGGTLAYVGIEAEGDDLWARANIFTTPASGGADTRLTDTDSPADGPEYSPDGAWILFNTEVFGTTPGHAQIARMRPDGSGLEQLTDDERVNWFPHVAPDGTRAVYISFPPGTIGHPADKAVELRIVEGDAWRAPVRSIPLFGGQGTVNVNSWAPTSDRFAYVAYPVRPRTDRPLQR